ncbi:hypothetical protein H6G41_22865 [Tolypothrix sp. FACHB-123]|uniref:hypothetical protein n=1 Tax=Tolypothrix sp. FACHB-123 TaxID=2692868 RepID=UPI0016834D06|nr:hypothetical protein [Tolypothrix sp. FACHB-123]MBD2357425.1 hypothetical protein [Tolypothrix sp. FACHB-123]
MADTAVKLGLAFDLNGTPIALEPKQAISEIKKQGFEVELPKRLELGSAGDGIDNILKQLGSTYRVNQSADSGVTVIKSKLPNFNVLTQLYDKVATARLSVEKFHVKIPGDDYLTEKKKTDASAQITSNDYKYTIGLSATWPLTGNETGLTLTGIYFEVSNEPGAIAQEKAAASS